MPDVDLSTWITDKRASSVRMTLDGKLFVLPPPQLWPDEASGLFDNVAFARCLIDAGQAIDPEAGDYDAFVAAGGSQGVVAAQIREHFGDKGE